MDIKKFSLSIVGLIWLLVGLGLSTAGINWLLKLGFGPKLVIFLTIALSVGLLKGKFVLQKAAQKYYKGAEVINFKRIDIFIGWLKVLGIRGIILIGLMIALGSFLRHSNIDRPILGIIYLAVGIAMVYAGKIFFKKNNTI